MGGFSFDFGRIAELQVIENLEEINVRRLRGTPSRKLYADTRARWGASAPALGEGRAVVKLVRGLASCPAAHGHKAASLQDNTAVSGSFSKGRSAAPALNYLARQRAGSSLASGVQVLLPWVESARQPADGLSREVPMPHEAAWRQET